MNRRSALLAVAALAFTGCATVPTSGSIHEVAGAGSSPQSAPFDFSPAGPRVGASPEEIVEGFLTAQLATPVNTFAARSFLTKDSASSWAPDTGTVIFADRRLSAQGRRVRITMTAPVTLDGQGRWNGPARRRYVDVRLVQEAGEWRISDPPDALLISQTHFEARFRQYSIYFFDPSGRVLVPEPVFVPWGVQAATRLVTALLMGPPQSAAAVERSYFPPTADLDISVPVIADGVADVPLIAAAGSLSGAALERATAQIAWTLRQVPGVTRARLTVGGQPLDLPGMEEGLDVSSWGPFAPSVIWSATDLFGLQGTSVVRVQDREVAPTSLTQLPSGGRYVSLGLGLSADVAAVVDDRSRVYRISAGDEPPVLVYDGASVLRPLWDLQGHLWLYDRGLPGSVRIYGDGGQVQSLPLRLPDGFVPDSLALSRDGSRLVLGGRGGAWVVRVARSQVGGVTGLSLPSRVLITDPDDSVISLAWRSPTDLAGIVAASGRDRLLAIFSVDGSTLKGETSTMPAGVVVVATEPDDESLIYASTGTRLFQRTDEGSWRPVDPAAAIAAVTFVG